MGRGSRPATQCQLAAPPCQAQMEPARPDSGPSWSIITYPRSPGRRRQEICVPGILRSVPSWRPAVPTVGCLASTKARPAGYSGPESWVRVLGFASVLPRDPGRHDKMASSLRFDLLTISASAHEVCEIRGQKSNPSPATQQPCGPGVMASPL